MSCKKIAVAQPTFLPWVGWFDLADQVDSLVILDDVSFSKQSWQQRNRIRTYNGLEYISVPVKTAGRFGQKISECELANQLFVAKLIKSIRANYCKTPFFDVSIDSFITTLQAAVSTNKLVEVNSALITWMAARLEVLTPMIRASTLGVGGERGEHVAAICEILRADCYISPPGSEGYLIEDKQAFESRSIKISIHTYEHPVYSQRYSPFIPFASALDLIFNCGPNAGNVLRSGRRLTRALGENTFNNLEGIHYEN